MKLMSFQKWISPVAFDSRECIPRVNLERPFRLLMFIFNSKSCLWASAMLYLPFNGPFHWFWEIYLPLWFPFIRITPFPRVLKSLMDSSHHSSETLALQCRLNRIVVHDDVLYLQKGGGVLRRCIPRADTLALLCEYHDNPWDGHAGVDKVYQSLRCNIFGRSRFFQYLNICFLVPLANAISQLYLPPNFLSNHFLPLLNHGK